ncbi:MAG: virulence factor MviN [Nitrospira sp. CG24E]|nr:MAG: virulence factor MviN [Nitrospira sp. CG24E]
MMKSAVQVGLNWWSTWQERSVNRRIFAAMVTVGGCTTLVKLTAAVKEMAVAYQFGTSDELDAFLIAFVLPAFAVTLIGGSLNGALIPTYIQVREQEGQPAAQRLLSSIMVVSIGFLVVLSMILALTASYCLPLMASGFSAEKMAVTQSLYWGLLSTLVLSGVATTWGAILNAEHRFALAAVAPVATSIATMVAVIVMAKYWGSYALVAGIVGGALLEAGVVGWGLKRTGVSLLPRWYGASLAIKQVLQQYAPMVAAAFLMSGTAVVGQSMAAMLGPGDVSALSYGNKITSLILGIVALTVSSAVMPHFSRMVARAEWPGLRHTLLTYSRWLLIGTLPVTVALIYYSEPVVALLFQRGAFSAEDTRLVGQIQAMYLLQVPLYVVSMLFARLISALKEIKWFMWGNAINLSMYIVLTYALMQRFGVAGIALATSLMYLISCGFLLWVSLRLLQARAAGRQ